MELLSGFILSLIPQEAKTYLSFNGICPINEIISRRDDVRTFEFFNIITSL